MSTTGEERKGGYGEERETSEGHGQRTRVGSCCLRSRQKATIHTLLNNTSLSRDCVSRSPGPESHAV